MDSQGSQPVDSATISDARFEGNQMRGVQRSSAGGAASTVEPALPPPWQEHFDTTYNQHYYHNRMTGETTWCVPRFEGIHTSGVGRSSAWGAASAMEPALPPLWEAFFDTTYNHHYYHHILTGETTWSVPEHSASEERHVVAIGEKPIVAKALKRALSTYPFLGYGARWTFTSTHGHLLDLQFEGQLPGWSRTRNQYSVGGQRVLFTLPAEECPVDVEEVALIKSQCENADFIVLCLDNDLEGEAIADEISISVRSMLRPPRFGKAQQIWRCRFSSLDVDSLRLAMDLPPRGSLQKVNQDFVDAVKVRRELDLRLGFAVSRATKHVVWNSLLGSGSDGLRHFQQLSEGSGGHPNGSRDADRGLPDPGAWPVLSYGPCQCPTLGFVVKNDVDICTFQPAKFWKIKVDCSVQGYAAEAWSEVFTSHRQARKEAALLKKAVAAAVTPPVSQTDSNKKECTVSPDGSEFKHAYPQYFKHGFSGKDLNASVERKVAAGYKRPLPLNTPRMLQIASDCLGLSPVEALKLAEELYLAEYLTYPRSETTVYGAGTDFEAAVNGIITDHAHFEHLVGNSSQGRRGGMRQPAGVQTLPHPWEAIFDTTYNRHYYQNRLTGETTWSAPELPGASLRRYALNLLQDGLAPPRQDGKALGDHDPIMPVIHRSRQEVSRKVSKKAFDLYDLISRVFLASVSPDAMIEETNLTFEIPFTGVTFKATGIRTRSLGWIEILPIVEVPQSSPLPDEVDDFLHFDGVGNLLAIEAVSVKPFKTDPPARLAVSELLADMERHGIGTDASMATHIENVVKRSYAYESTTPRPRRTDSAAEYVPDHWFKEKHEMCPTPLGSIMFHWYMLIAPELALPSVRADVEAACTEVASGVRLGSHVLEQFLDQFLGTFTNMFDSQEASRHRDVLVAFLAKAEPERQQDPNWMSARKSIKAIDMDILAQRRALSTQADRPASAPTDVPLNHCLMINASVLKELVLCPGDEFLAVAGPVATLACDLRPGDELLAVAGQLEGTCIVRGVRIFEERERDVTSVEVCGPRIPGTEGYSFDDRGDNWTVDITSNHALLAKRQYDLAWGPVEARRLTSDFEVRLTPVDSRFQDLRSAFEVVYVGTPLATTRRESVRVVELELDSGEAAVRLQMSGVVLSYNTSAFIASYGESPRQRHTPRRCVSIWGFSRAPRGFINALTESESLEECRAELTAAEISFRFSTGGFLFVRAADAELVHAALRRQGIAPRSSEVVVAPEFETRLEEALRLEQPRCNVHRRRTREVRLDAALGDLLHFTNGRPFAYEVGGVVVQGRRTFIEIPEDDTTTSGPLSARSAPA